jgi:hypothetical protein
MTKEIVVVFGVLMPMIIASVGLPSVVLIIGIMHRVLPRPIMVDLIRAIS